MTQNSKHSSHTSRCVSAFCVFSVIFHAVISFHNLSGSSTGNYFYTLRRWSCNHCSAAAWGFTYDSNMPRVSCVDQVMATSWAGWLTKHAFHDPTTKNRYSLAELIHNLRFIKHLFTFLYIFTTAGSKWWSCVHRNWQFRQLTFS
jgi:hypothetical protein